MLSHSKKLSDSNIGRYIIDEVMVSSADVHLLGALKAC